MTHRLHRRGFTLIELLIVVGIIVVLLVVLAVAILPKLITAKENNTKTLLNNAYSGLPLSVGALTPAKFRSDAGTLSRKIHPDDKIESSQMLLFYLAPSRPTWDGSKLYAGRNYDPPNTPETFAEFTMEEADRLPWLVDAWGKELWYRLDRGANVAYLQSAGQDSIWDNEDDLIYDPRSGTVKNRSDMTKR
jgi:prepilin-type N-terminal cleavage/methylation domain-containing protein